MVCNRKGWGRYSTLRSLLCLGVAKRTGLFLCVILTGKSIEQCSKDESVIEKKEIYLAVMNADMTNRITVIS